MVAFSTGPTAAEGWWNRFRRETVRQQQTRGLQERERGRSWIACFKSTNAPNTVLRKFF